MPRTVTPGRLLHLTRRLFARAPTIDTPRRIRLEASSFCQLRCPSCPTTTRAIDPAVGGGFLRLASFRSLVDANPRLERIEMSNYGEVFLNPELREILAYAHRRGVAITIENGANLNHARDDALGALVEYEVRTLTVSIDGASADTYAIYRVGGDFERVLANIGKINEHKRRTGSRFPHLVWQFVVFGHNEHEIAAARRMAEARGMEFRTKLTWDDAFSPIRDHALVRATVGGPTTRAEYEALNGRKYAHTICEQLWDEPQINWDGKVLGCCRNFWGDFGGNAFADGLDASLRHEKMVYARTMLRGQAPPRDDIPCTTCEMYQAMRERSDFIPKPPASVAEAAADVAAEARREIEARLADVDAVLGCSSWFGRKAALRRVHRLALSPAFAAMLTPTGVASPAVSVVLPTRNRAGIVREAIATVQAQTFRDWELIVVDDGSTDATADVVRPFLADARIRYVAQVFAGHAVARNRGVREARGSLIAYLDSDNLWYPSFLAASVVALAAYPDADCVYGVLLTDAHATPSRAAPGVLFEAFDRRRLLEENFIDINTLVHRCALVAAYGGFDESLERLVDWDLVLRYTEHTPPRRIPVLAARYRIRDGQRVTVTRPLEPSLSAIRRKWPSHDA
ncbi:MAG: glycosyltransferase [Candidatus Binatia bacterium]